MLFGFRGPALLLALCYSSISAAARGPEVLQPTEKWVVNFHDSQCVASRNYGTDDQPLMLVVKAPAMGEIIQLLIMDKGNVGRFAEQRQGSISFNSAKPMQRSVLYFSQKGQRALSVNLPVAEFEQAKTASTLTFKTDPGAARHFSLGGMGALMRVMEQCRQDLAEVWHVHPESGPDAHVQQPMQGSIQGLVKSEDYPAAALDREQEGTAGFLMLVNEAGKVADCTVIVTSGVASLDAQACGLIKERAKFKPAIGRDGKPIKTHALQRIHWRVAF